MSICISANILKQPRRKNEEPVYNGVVVPMDTDAEYLTPPGSPDVQPPVVVVKLEEEEVEHQRTHVIAGEVDHEKLASLEPHTRALIEGVIVAFRKSFDQAPDNSSSRQPNQNKDFLNMAESSVLRCIEMAKNIDMFKRLHMSDRVTLIKGAVLEVLILRSVKLFDSKSLQWINTAGASEHRVSAAALQRGNKESVEFFQQYTQFAARFQSTIKNDNIVLMILMVMTILSPDRKNIMMKGAVCNAQEAYASVLREYIKLNYPEDKEMFAKSLHQLTEIRELDESHMQIIMKVQVSDLTDLIKEIFNLWSAG